MFRVCLLTSAAKLAVDFTADRSAEGTQAGDEGPYGRSSSPLGLISPCALTIARFGVMLQCSIGHVASPRRVILLLLL